MSEPKSTTRTPFTQRLTVRPVLFALSIVATLVFSVAHFWAIETYATFSRDSHQADLRKTVQILIEHQLAALHVPAVLDMASGIVAAQGFREALSRGNAAELDSILADSSRQQYVASGRIALLSLTAFDRDLVPLAATSAPSFAGAPWEDFLAGVAGREGLARKQVASKYMLDSEGNPLHVTIYPVGVLRTVGYLGIATSPLPALDGLGETLSAGVTIRSVAGRDLLVQAAEPPTDLAGDETPVYDVVETGFVTSDRVELFRLFIETDVTAYEHAATHVKTISYTVALVTILVVWGVGLWLLRATVFRRISKISSALRAIAAGDRRVEVPPAGRDEIGRMSEDLKTVIGYVTQIVTLKESLSHTNVKLNHEIAERGRAEVSLRATKEQAEAASQAKSEFLAAMSHELRTPLNAIIGFSEIIKNETLGPVGSVHYRGYAQDINDSGQHLLGLINDILDLSKVESGKEELYEEDTLVPAIIASVLRLVQQRAENDLVAIELDVAAALPLLHADERKVKQILVNLLSNAIKFTEPDGKVTLRAWCDAEGGHVFQVADTGIGIAPENITKVMAPFQQVDGDLDRRFEGTGLGLPLTQGMVELHGGSLELQSEVGAGTTVTVRFPAERVVRPPDSTDALDGEIKAAG
jgi:signal transduction histidine kinase